MRRSSTWLLLACWLFAIGPAFAAEGTGQGAILPGPDADSSVDPQTIEGCVLSAANLYQLPPLLLIILLHVEGGRLGQTHENSDGSVDIGPMQINQQWLPQLADHWHASMGDTYNALDTSFCANVEAGSWILRRSIDAAGGQLWLGVAFYHSHNLTYEDAYLQQVLREARLLETIAGEGNQ
jgi:hypothetical protein